MRVGVIIVTHNSQNFLSYAVNAVKKQTRPVDRLVVVDSGSTSVDYLSPYKEVVIAGENIGYCGGNNRGYDQIARECDYILFLNPDAYLTPTFIEGAVKKMERHPKCGALTGLLAGYDNQAAAPSGFIDSTGIFQKWYGKWYDRGQGDSVEEGKYAKPDGVMAICGAAMFCRVKALKQQPYLFDPKFFMYKEDIDLSLRLRGRGWELLYFPDLLVYHCRGWGGNRYRVARRLRYLSARNEFFIHWRLRRPLPLLYSLCKVISVRLLGA